MSKSVHCEPAKPKTGFTYKYCESFVNVLPVEVPDIPVAKKWKYSSVFLPEKYVTIAEKIANFHVRPDDVWVVSFPKCGSTWTQEMVRMILSDLDYQQASQQALEEKFTFFESSCIFDSPESTDSKCEIQIANELPSPRYFKTHLPIQLLPTEIWSVRPRIIYTARNSKDTAVSFYHFFRSLCGYRGDMDACCRAFLADEVIFAPYSEHVLNFWTARDEPNILFLTYEEMKGNLMHVLVRTQTFLGKKFTEEQLERLCRHLDADTMRKNVSANATMSINIMSMVLGEEVLDRDYKFVRKGIAGSFKTEMPSEYIRLFDEDTSRSFANTGLTFHM